MTISQMKYYKQKYGYSYAQLSSLSGVPQGTIQKIFNGETKSPRYDTLLALEKVLRPKEGNILREEIAYDSREGWQTVDDYYLLPDERKVELIDGKFYDMASPGTAHQIVIAELFFHISGYIRENQRECILFMAPMDVQLDQDDFTMVQPDLFVLCDRRKLTNHCVSGAPDWVIEILSDSTRRRDAFLKLHKYQNAGVREYWMVDPKKERIVAYCFDEDEIPQIYGSDSEIPVGIYDGQLVISCGEIFDRIRQLIPG